MPEEPSMPEEPTRPDDDEFELDAPEPVCAGTDDQLADFLEEEVFALLPARERHVAELALRRMLREEG